MAVFFPPLEHINNLSQPLTDSERYLLFFLRYLDDSYEIFYQSYVNGLRPDIVIMRRHHGVLIIEVKDWNLSLYEQRDKHKNWFLELEQDFIPIRSPEKQVETIKNALFDLYIPKLLEKRIKNPNYYSIVSCSVYFHNNNGNHPIPYNKYNSFIFKDTLTKDNFNQLLKKHYINTLQESKLFKEDLYKQFKRELNPPKHLLEEGKPIIYTSRQQSIINLLDREGSTKIKGYAGGGKTTIMAQMAVNAYKKHKKRVLILTFNITLKNYIRDKINRIREEFPWDYFYITHYHSFLKNYLNKADNISDASFDYDEELTDFPAENEKFDYIFIDEIQDYKKNWVLNIKKFLINSNNNLIVFGDEKQNIYNREMQNNEKEHIKPIPYTGISGAWNLLNENHRLGGKINEIVDKFQQRLKDKYEINSIQTSQSELSLNDSSLQYHFLQPIDHIDFNSLIKLANDFIEKENIHVGDACFLSDEIKPLRKLDQIYSQHKRRTCITFESEEIFQLLLKKYNISDDIEISENKDNLELPFITDVIEQIKQKISNQKDIYTFIHDIIKQNTHKNTIELHILQEIYKQLIPEATSLQQEKLKDKIKKTKGLQHELNQIRRSKKMNFWPKNGKLKLSTIHSFKGWEAHTLFLIISKDFNTQNTDELIYTGLSRCKKNLIILNLGNKDLHKFFMNNQDIFE